MKQRAIYANDIERHIEGVIKADSIEYIVQEVKEYIVTNELERHLSHFFSEYAKDRFSASVWISGFFGSGKSHLLKILSYILENKSIEGVSCNKLFKDKIINDFELQANIEKASKIPAETILFNIDQKAAAITTKSSTDAILSVFLRVFNEHLGYFGGDSFIADIERNLDEQGLFDKFKQEFINIAGNSWDNIRDSVYFRTDEFAKAYSNVKKVSVDDANKLLDRQADYSLSVEDFVKLVEKYIKTKPLGFRLIFCVDEIGQYIADNTRLMLNLQTLAETLQTHTNGKAFLIVTSQNDISSVIKNLARTNSNDFSRIQDRFPLKMDLKSSDVDEVVQKRLLAKSPEGNKELTSIYHVEKNNLQTLFRFTDNSRQYKEFNGDDSFVKNYPFVPYQFDLFQSTLRGLSEHNVFQGIHQSVGERSVIGVFQTVAKKLVDSDIGVFVDYASIFDGIRATLKSEIQASIIQAEKTIDDPLAISILKALFLVKYVDEFKANLQNITVLLQNSRLNEIESFRNSIQTALNKLENQTYIHRNGELYGYLTNDEKDIENEIKATSIDDSEISKSLADLIFSEILKDSKVKLAQSNQPYEFGKKLDDSLIGREKDFFVHFISPLNQNDITQANINMKSFGNTDLIIHLAGNDRIIDELRMFLKTNKYIQLKNNQSIPAERKALFIAKQELNQTRRKNLLDDITELIKNAPMYLSGTEITDIAIKEPVSKIKEAVQKLIYQTYPNLRQLSKEYKEEDIKRILSSNDDVLLHSDLTQVEQEFMLVLNRKKNSSERVTVRSAINDFSCRPFGWYETATLCIICHLFKKNRIAVKFDSNPLDQEDLLLSINNRNKQEQLIVEIEEDISNSEIKKLKDLHNDFFNESNSGNDAKQVSAAFKSRLKKEYDDLLKIKSAAARFTFVSNLDEPLCYINNLVSKDYPYFFKYLSSFEDKLLDTKEQIIDPIKRFINSPQKVIYENIKNFYEDNAGNIGYLEETEQSIISEFLDNKSPYSGNCIQVAKQNFDSIQLKLNRIILDAKSQSVQTVSELMDNVTKSSEYSKLSEKDKNCVNEPFLLYNSRIEKENLIGNIKVLADNFRSDVYPKQLQTMAELALRVDSGQKTVDGGHLIVNGKNHQPTTNSHLPSANNQQPTTAVSAPVAEYVSIRITDFNTNITVIENEKDVDEYVESIRKTLISMIKNNKKITLC